MARVTAKHDFYLKSHSMVNKVRGFSYEFCMAVGVVLW
jgi:hypothetical protein